MHATLLLFDTGNWGLSLGALREIQNIYKNLGEHIFTLYPNTWMGKIRPGWFWKNILRSGHWTLDITKGTSR